MEAHGWLLTTLKSGSLFSREILLNFFYAVTKCLLQEREEQEGNLELNQHAQHPNRHDPYFTTTTEQGQAHGTHRQGCSQGLYCWRHSGAARQQTRVSSFLISSLMYSLLLRIRAHPAQGKSKPDEVKWQEEGELQRLKSQSFGFQRKCRWFLVQSSWINSKNGGSGRMWIQNILQTSLVLFWSLTKPVSTLDIGWY